VDRLDIGVIPPKGDGLCIAQGLLEFGGQFVLAHDGSWLA
jgi:hypothetical protein